MNAPTPNSLKKMHDANRVSSPTPPEKASKISSSKQQNRGKKSESTPGSEGKGRTSKSNSSREVSESTDRSRQNNKQKLTASEGSQKKPFVRKEHLTQNPLRQHEGLHQLKSTLTNSKNGKSGVNNRTSRKTPDRHISKSSPDARQEALVEKLKTFVDTHELLDISNGSEKALGVSVTKMIKAVDVLKSEGYHRYYLKIQAVGSDARVIIRVLTVPEITLKDLVNRRNDIKSISSNKETN